MSYVFQVDCFKETAWILRPQTYDIITQLQIREEKGRHSRNNYLICILLIFSSKFYNIIKWVTCA